MLAPVDLAPSRPALRWHGGKWRLAPWIVRNFPPHRIYVEPFGGAASVLLRKPRSYAEVYNDLDGDAVNVFRVLRNPKRARRLKHLIEFTPFAREEFLESYEGADDPVERARRTIARSFMAHGTTSRRRNQTGFRAKAYRQGKSASADFASWPEQIDAFTRRLAGVVIERRDALKVIATQDTPETLVYCDPPYVPDTRSSWRGSHNDRAFACEMDDDGHRRLAACLRSIESMVVLSGYAGPLYDADLYADWHRVERAAFADAGMARVEVLWINDAAWRRLHMGQLI